jgi:hypothetical protein
MKRLILLTAFVFTLIGIANAQQKNRATEIHKGVRDEAFIIKHIDDAVEKNVRPTAPHVVVERRSNLPSDACSAATALPVPSTIPNCATITTTPPETATCTYSSTLFLDEANYTNSSETPAPGSGCGFYTGGTIDVWHTVSIPAGAAGFQLDLDIPGMTYYSGTSTAAVLAQAYTGSCGALSAVGDCEPLALFSSGTISDYVPVQFTGFTGPTTVYIRIYTYSNNSSHWSDDWEIGSATISLLPPPPSNESCGGCDAVAITGCNLGAPAESSWVGPSVSTADGGAGILCSGNGWSSNDNPVYFCLTATANNPTITVENVSCNGGTTGIAQFGAFTSCADVGIYTKGGGPNGDYTDFLGCAAGTGTVTLTVGGAPGTSGTENYPDITSGQSFILVVDGNAGDNCTWEFQTTGVETPVELMNFWGEAKGDTNILYWQTASENNNSHFFLQRSADGVRFETIAKILGKGNSSEPTSYAQEDENPLNNIAYYRLQQVDFDGKTTESQLVKIKRARSWREFTLYPSPLAGNRDLTLSFSLDRAQQMDVRLVDTYGRVLSHQTFEGQKGENIRSLEAAQLPSGIYFAIMSNGNEMSSQKIVKYN